MRFQDYYNAQILSDLAKDKNKLRDLAYRDSGFILKRFEEEKIFPEKSIIKDIGNPASIIFLFNNYKITDDEKVYYSKFFKDNSEVMKKINSEVVMSKDGFISLLQTEDASFSHPGYYLSQEDFIKYEKEIIDFDTENDEKRSYIVSSLINLPDNELKQLPLTIFRRFYEVYDFKAETLFKEEEHVKNFKEIHTWIQNADYKAIFEYYKVTKELDCLNYLEWRSHNATLTSGFLSLVKEVDPNVSSDDIFYNAPDGFRQEMLRNDFASDFNVSKAVQFYTNNYNLAKDVFDNISYSDNGLPPTLAKYLNASFKSKDLSIDEIAKKIKNYPKVQWGAVSGIDYKIENSWRRLKEKEEDEGGEPIDENVLKEATIEYWENVFHNSCSTQVVIDQEVIEFVIENTKPSINKYLLMLSSAKNSDVKIDLEKEAKKMPSDIVKAIHDFFENPNSYTEESLLYNKDWWGGSNNFIKNNQEQIIFTENLVNFFVVFKQKDFVLNCLKNDKAVFCNGYLKESLNYVNDVDEIPSILRDYIPLVDKRTDNSFPVRHFLRTLKNNKQINKKLWGNASLENENEVVSQIVEHFTKVIGFINKNPKYFYNVRNSQDREYMDENTDKLYAELVNLEDGVEELKKKFAKLSSSSVDILKKTLKPSNFNEAYVAEWLLPKMKVVDNFIVSSLNNKTLDATYINRSFYEKFSSRSGEGKSIWNKLNDDGKVAIFSELCKNIEGRSFYEVFNYFEFKKPKTALDKKLKEILLDTAPEKILYCSYEATNHIEFNIHDLYEICKKISENKSWNFRRDTNTRFSEFVSAAWKKSKVKDYEDVLEKAKIEDPRSYVMLLAFSKFYGYDFKFKDHDERDLPFSDFKAYSDEILNAHPERRDQDKKHIPYLEYWINKKMDAEVVAEGINLLRQDFIVPMIKARDNDDYNSYDFHEGTMIEQFPLFEYADFPYHRLYDHTNAEPAQPYQLSGISKVVDLLLEKDVANFNFLTQKTFCIKNLDIERKASEILNNIDNVDDFRRFFLATISDGFSKDGTYLCATVSEPKYDNVKEKIGPLFVDCLENFALKDPAKAHFTSYLLSHHQTCDKNFKYRDIAGSLKKIKDGAILGGKYRGFPEFSGHIKDVSNMFNKKELLDKAFENCSFNDDVLPEEEQSDYGFKL